MAPQVSGGTLWEFAPPALVPDLEVGRLGRQAAQLAEAGEAEAAHVRSLAAAAEARRLPSAYLYLVYTTAPCRLMCCAQASQGMTSSSICIQQTRYVLARRAAPRV